MADCSEESHEALRADAARFLCATRFLAYQEIPPDDSGDPDLRIAGVRMELRTCLVCGSTLAWPCVGVSL